LAVDISSAAVERARARLHANSAVVIERQALPGEMPSGPFDLVVASDVLYYLSEADVLASLRALAGVLAPGGRMVCVHYGPPMGALLTGAEVHRMLGSVTLAHAHSEVLDLSHGPWLLDRFDKPSGGRGHGSRDTALGRTSRPSHEPGDMISGV
jgi:predicted TPR repeat methyltransferase